MRLAPAILFLFALSVKAVTLAWTANAEDNIAGYNLYYGPASGSYTQVKFSGPETQIIVTDLPAITTYFALTAVNTLGEESLFSDEVVYTENSEIVVKLEWFTAQSPVVSWSHPATALCDVLEWSSDLRTWIPIDASFYHITVGETRVSISTARPMRYFRVRRPQVCS